MKQSIILLALVALAACGSDDLDDHSGRPATQSEESESFAHAVDWWSDRGADTSSVVQPAVIYSQPIRCDPDEARECCDPNCAAAGSGFEGEACLLPDGSGAIALSTNGFCQTLRVKLDAVMCGSVSKQIGAGVSPLPTSCVRG